MFLRNAGLFPNYIALHPRTQRSYMYLLIYLFMVYLTALSIVVTAQLQMVGRLVNDTLERVWNAVA
jgi:hypothetical protein